MLSRKANCFLHRLGKQVKISENSESYLVVKEKTVKSLNLYIRKLFNENSLFVAFHI